MKAIVQVDFGWVLTNCLRYARQQVMMINAIKEKGIKTDDIITLLLKCKTKKDAIDEMIVSFGFDRSVASIITDTSIVQLTSLETDDDLDYFTRVVKAITPLHKELYQY